MTWLFAVEGTAVVLALVALTFVAYVHRVSLAVGIGLSGRRGTVDDGPAGARPPDSADDLTGPPVSHPWPSVTVVPTDHSR